MLWNEMFTQMKVRVDSVKVKNILILKVLLRQFESRQNNYTLNRIVSLRIETKKRKIFNKYGHRVRHKPGIDEKAISLR